MYNNKPGRTTVDNDNFFVFDDIEEFPLLIKEILLVI